LVDDTVAAGLEHARATHRLILEGSVSIWVTTDLRIEYKDGVPVRALGTVMSFS